MYTKDELNELINKAITSLPYNDESERLIEPVRYILSLGGKRLRPLMTLMACNIFNDNPEQALMPAIGLEVFHNFTLVHDDIMDNAALRRNFPTVHHKWNINQAILSGDVMAFIANDYIAQAPTAALTRVFRLYNKTGIEVCTGQQLDMDYEKRRYVSIEEYLRMIELKTAVLVAACMKTGAVIGGAGDREAELMYQFGRYLGLAFQIQDDILDVYGDSAVFGKQTGNDIVSNKKTFLLVKAIELSDGDISKRLLEQISLKDFDPTLKVKAVKVIYDELGIRKISEDLAGEYIDKAFDYLNEVPVSNSRKEALHQLASDLIDRDR